MGHDVHTALDEGLDGRPDAEVWAACCTEDRFLITLDTDFGDIRAFDASQGPGIFLLRGLDQSTRRLADLAARVPGHLDLSGARGRLWIVTDLKIRAR